MVYTNEILTLAVEIGDSMLRNGAEIYRVEDTVVHILKSYEVKEFDVYVISNGIFASANENQEDAWEELERCQNLTKKRTALLRF